MRQGFFVAIDGPSGIGKSTLTGLLADRLIAHGCSVMATKEPTATPLGSLARFGTDDYQGLTLACLVAADRYQHLEHEIRPALQAGRLVLCDRYFGVVAGPATSGRGITRVRMAPQPARRPA